MTYYKAATLSNQRRQTEVSQQSNSQTFPLNRILSIASNTFREAVRDRVLYNLVLFVLLITASAIFLGELTAGQEARTIVKDFCAEYSIPYYETTVSQSYAEVLSYLHRVGAPLRQSGPVLDEVSPIA